MSDGLGLILPPGKGQPLILTTTDDISSQLTGAAPTADRATLVWVGRLAKPLRVVDFTIYVVTSVGTVDIGMFTLSAKTGTPTATRLGSTGSTTLTPTSDIQTIAPSATLWLPDYTDVWAGASFSSASSSVGRTTPLAKTAAFDARVGFAATQTPLGTGFTLTLGTAFCPWIAIRLSET